MSIMTSTPLVENKRLWFGKVAAWRYTRQMVVRRKTARRKVSGVPITVGGLGRLWEVP